MKTENINGSSALRNHESMKDTVHHYIHTYTRFCVSQCVRLSRSFAAVRRVLRTWFFFFSAPRGEGGSGLIFLSFLPRKNGWIKNK